MLNEVHLLFIPYIFMSPYPAELKQLWLLLSWSLPSRWEGHHVSVTQMGMKQ